jgi:hypothetical protein
MIELAPLKLALFFSPFPFFLISDKLHCVKINPHHYGTQKPTPSKSHHFIASICKL